jgi:hypothetical protein
MALVAWALWLGGLVTLFIAVQSLFTTFADRHDLAGAAASAIFARFNVYQMVLALITLFAALLVPYRGRAAKSTCIVLIALALAFALFVSSYLAPHLELMREQGITHTAEFAKLHGLSMALYMAEVLLLLPVGPLLFVGREPRR